jgi:hypothetical protein
MADESVDGAPPIPVPPPPIPRLANRWREVDEEILEAAQSKLDKIEDEIESLGGGAGTKHLMLEAALVMMMELEEPILASKYSERSVHSAILHTDSVLSCPYSKRHTDHAYCTIASLFLRHPSHFFLSPL